ELAFLGHFLPDAAERLWCNTKVRCNEVLRNALYELGIQAGEFQIAMSRIFAGGFGDTIMQMCQCILEENSKKPVVKRVCFAELLETFLVQQQSPCWFQGLNIKSRRFVGKVAGSIGNPVVFQGKLYG